MPVVLCNIRDPNAPSNYVDAVQYDGLVDVHVDPCTNAMHKCVWLLHAHTKSSITCSLIPVASLT